MSGFGGVDGPDLARIRAQTDALQRDSVARRAGEAIRDGIAEWRANNDERSERTAAALEALLTLTERQAQETEERERAMLDLTRRSVRISLAAAIGTFLSVVAAVIAIIAS